MNKHQDYTNTDVQLYYRSVPNPVPSTALGSPKSLAVKRQIYNVKILTATT